MSLCPETKAPCNNWECGTYAGCSRFAERVKAQEQIRAHSDWASFMLTVDDSLARVELLLTNYPPAQPLDRATQDEVIGHLQAAMVAIDQVGAWVRAH